MEELYSSVIEGGRIHSVDWSSLNLLALSISLTKNGYVGEGFGSSKTHQLLVVDANRPWEYHVVYGDNKTVSVNVKWSLSGMLLLSVEQDSVARVWRMKDNCINTWSRIHKIQLKENDKLLHSSWVEYQPLPNININKEAWPELLEYHPHSSYLHSIVPEATVFVYESGLVQLVSFSDKDQDVSVYDAQLEVEGSLWTSRTLAASDGTVLCVVVCNDGLVKLFVLKLSLNSESSLSLTASLATSFHPTGGGGGQLTDLIVHPDTGGCLLHICYDKTNLLQWSLRDITQSGNYMAKRESLYIIHHPVSAMTCTALCLKGCGTSPSSLVTTPAPGSEFMLDVTSESRDKNWPIELIVMLHTDNSITVLNRTSYQVLCNYKLGDGDGEPGAKRLKTEGDWGGAAGGVVNGDCNICISPNGGCVAVATEGVINVIAFSPFFLGEKGFESPDISRWSLLLALAAVKNVSVWDIAVMCSRVSYRHKDGGLIMKVLEQWGKDFTRNSDTWRDTLLPVYYRICLTLHCCHDHGLTHALDQRDVLRLHSTFSLFLLSLSSNKESDSSLAYSLKDCAESPEDNIDAITRSLQNKDFEIDKDIASELQVHAHWIIEFSLKVSSRIANLMVGRYPDRLSLKVLRQCLMLIFIWNKVLKMPVLSISDSSLSLLFKVITCTINNEMNVLDESLKSDLLRNIPPMESYSTLTLTKAANLQGFLHGLSKTAELPETFYREIPPRLRPHVQANYSSYDPYSPLGLVVPKGISPPWRDRFIEGQLDVIHGGILTNAVLRDTKLRQCSNCRSWTVVSGTSSVDPATPSSLSSPIQQWRHSWTRHCLCGSMWLHTKQ